MRQTTDNWVCIDTYTTLQQAAIARGVLESHGIRAIIPDDVMSGSVYPMTLTWSAIELYVHADEAETARRLLQQH